MYPTLENSRKEIRERPDENGRKGVILRQRDWKRMMDGNVSHSFEFKLVTHGANVAGVVVCVSISFLRLFVLSCYFTLMFTSFVFIVFLIQWGRIPRMAKTRL
jgi:hypothetical protein